MRKLIFGINVTIDGCCDHTVGISNDEVHQYFARLTREAGTLLYGRKTYELMVPFWPDIAKNPTGHPKAYVEFAQAFVSVPQIISFSRSLGLKLEDEVKKLKQQKGKSILTGGVVLPSELFKLGLVDEIHLVVHPMVAGKGRRLFDDLDLQKQPQLKLVESCIFKSGHVALHYTR